MAEVNVGLNNALKELRQRGEIRGKLEIKSLREIEWIRETNKYMSLLEGANDFLSVGYLAAALLWAQNSGYVSTNAQAEFDAMEDAKRLAPTLFEWLEKAVKEAGTLEDLLGLVPANPKKLPLSLAGVFSYAARISPELPKSQLELVLKTLPRCLKKEIWEDNTAWWVAADAACRLMRDHLEAATEIHDAYMKLEFLTRHQIRSSAGWYAKHCLGEDWLKDYGTATQANGRGSGKMDEDAIAQRFTAGRGL